MEERKKPDYCPFCNQKVAPNEFGRVVNQHGTFHGKCWKEVLKIRELNKPTSQYQFIWVQ